MRCPACLLPACLFIAVLLLGFASPALASDFAAPVPVAGPLLASTESTPDNAPSGTPMTQDSELIREHERFASFAQAQVQRMNANIIGGKQSMHVYRGSDGMFRASYKAIDGGELVCHVSRAQHDPRYFVGVMIYKELILESKANTAEACRRGTFEPVAQKPQRVIYSSQRGGGWY